MQLPLPLLAVLPLTAATALTPQNIFSNPSSPSESTNRIPTSYESAVLARRILDLTGIGTLATVFPSSKSHSEDKDDEGHSNEQRPQNLGGMPTGLMGMSPSLASSLVHVYTSEARNNVFVYFAPRPTLSYLV